MPRPKERLWFPVGACGSPDLTNNTSANLSNINKNLTYCRLCGFCYSKKLKRCPKCGKKYFKPLYKRWWFWFFAVILAFLIIPSFGDNSKNATSNNTASNNTSVVTPSQNVPPASPVISESDYKAQCVSVPYKTIARNPNQFKGKKAVFTGKVVQVQEGGREVTLRVDVTKDKYGLWGDTIYVEYRRKNDNESRILDDDIITFYGEIQGIKSYTAVLGNQISIPYVKAEYITIK